MKLLNGKKRANSNYLTSSFQSLFFFFILLLVVTSVSAQLNIRLEGDEPFDGNISLVNVLTSSGYVPYVGAVTNVNLGAYNISAAWGNMKIDWSNIQNVPSGFQSKTGGGPYLYNTSSTIYFNDTFGNLTYVPYEGATRNVDLGDKNISANVANFTDLYVSNSTIYLGLANISSVVKDGRLYLNIPEAYINSTSYVGDGSRLTNITFEGGNAIFNGSVIAGSFNSTNFYGGNFTGDNITVDLVIGGNITGDNVTAELFYGGNFTGDWGFMKINWSDIQNVPSFINSEKNASGPYLYNDSTTIHFNETQLNKTINGTINELLITYKPTSIINQTGPNYIGDITSVQNLSDGNYYGINETLGIPGLDVRVNFTGVLSFNRVIIREYYHGGSNHDIEFEFWNYNTSSWDMIYFTSDESKFTYYELGIISEDDYIDGGLVQFRFYHDQSGKVSHYLEIEYVALQQFAFGPSMTEQPRYVSRTGDTMTGLLNSSGNITALVGNFTELYTSNGTLHIGNVSVSTSTQNGVKTFVVEQGAVINASGYVGDGSKLTNISFEGGNALFNGSVTAFSFNGTNYYGGNYTGDNITVDLFYGGNYTGDNVTAGFFLGGNVTVNNVTSEFIYSDNITANNITANNFYGGNYTGDWLFAKINWSNIQNVPSSFINTEKSGGGHYLYNDSTSIYLNETRLNNTIGDYSNGTYVPYVGGLSNLILSSYNITANFLFGTVDWSQLISVPFFVNNVTINPYLYLSGSSMGLNETTLNATIADIAMGYDTDTRMNASGPYLYNDTTTIYLNETKLNQTIDNRSAVSVFNYSLIVPVSGGVGTNTTTTFIDFEITQITVTPAGGGSYRFQAAESASGNIIDRDRQTHVGEWNVAKGYAIANQQVQANITSAALDGNYIVTIKYLNNFRP